MMERLERKKRRDGMVILGIVAGNRNPKVFLGHSTVISRGYAGLIGGVDTRG